MWRIGGLVGVAGLGLLILGALVMRGGPSSPTDQPLKLSESPHRIVAFGTSFTSSNKWPDELAQALQTCLNHPVDVVRVAQDGAGSSWALTQIEQVVDLRPDLVLIEFSINDADILDGVSLSNSQAQHAQLIDGIHAKAPDLPLVLMTMSPVSGPLRHLQRPLLARYYDLYKSLAPDRGLALADLTPRWQDALSRGGAQGGVAPPGDGLHPNNAASAQIIVPVLISLITTALKQEGIEQTCPRVH